MSTSEPAPPSLSVAIPPSTSTPVGDVVTQHEVRGLMTLQWSWGGLFDGRPAPGFDVCLVRSTGSGTPGPTLCGRDRFAPDAPGWSVGGGITGPNVHNTPCAGCIKVRDRDYPHLPVGGSLFAGMFARPLVAAGGAS